MLKSWPRLSIRTSYKWKKKRKTLESAAFNFMNKSDEFSSVYAVQFTISSLTLPVGNLIINILSVLPGPNSLLYRFLY